MTPLVFVALVAAGGLGASSRMLLDGLIKSRVSTALPWGTIIINVSGSLVLGLLTGLAGANLLPEAWHQVLGTGFLGGYTTFSTASFESVRLLQERRWAAGLVNGFGTLVFATAAEPHSDRRGRRGEDEGAKPVDQAGDPATFLEKPNSLEARRRKSRIATEESRAEHQVPGFRQQIRPGQPGQQSEYERPRDVDDDRSPRQGRAHAGLDESVEQHSR